MGYPSGMKAYKLYDVSKRKLFVSKDVLFFKEKFPFQSIKENNKPISHDFIDHFVIPCPLFDHLGSKNTIENSVDYSSENICQDSHGVDDPDLHIQTSEETNNTVQPAISIAPRRSSRPHCPPSYLKDFYCNLISQKPSYLTNFSPFGFQIKSTIT